MTFSFVSLFPNLLEFYFEDSILAKARQKDLFKLNFINPRAFSKSAYKKVDDYKIGGGAGLLMQPEPLFDTLNSLEESKAHFVFLNPCGKTFKQNDAKRLAKKSHIVLVCGRYEGIDERVIESFADEIFSIGDFILTGGELPALSIADAILRNIPGVLGNSQSLSEESFENSLLEAPSFTKPFEFKQKNEKFLAPSAFLKGNHARITALKNILASCKTKFYRPDLFLKHEHKENL